MGVLVCYDDFTYDVINDYHLDYLIEKGCIIGYDNSGNWNRQEELEQEAILLVDMVANESVETPLK